MNILFYCRTIRTKWVLNIATLLKQRGVLDTPSAFIAYYDEWRHVLNNSNIFFKYIYGTKEIFENLKKEKLDIEYLENIQKKYNGINTILNVAFTEPYLATFSHPKIYNHPVYTKTDYMLYIQLCFKMAEKIFYEAKPDAIIDFAGVNLFRGALDFVARYHNVPYLWADDLIALSDRIHISRYCLDDYEDIRQEYKKIVKQKVECNNGWYYLKEYQNNKSKKIYSSHLPVKKEEIILTNKRKGKFSKKKVFIENIKDCCKEIILRIKATKSYAYKYNFQLYKNVPSIKIIRYLKGKLANTYLKLFYNFESAPNKQRYAFLTLHLQPEASTSLIAPYYVNEVTVIENVARSLPLHWTLVVKPHPLMIDKKPISFYKTMRQIPNVRLVSPWKDSRELINGSSAVIAISGTSGFEGLLLGKKVIVFGKTPWSMVEGVSAVDAYSELTGIFEEAENYRPNYDNIACYLQAVHNQSFSMDIIKEFWESKHDLDDLKYRKSLNLIIDAYLRAIDFHHRNQNYDVFGQ